MIMKLSAIALFALAVIPTIAMAAPADDKKDPKKDDKGPVTVVFETSLGEFEVELNAEKAPVTVKNFLEYVDDKFYDGLVFHRVIASFMIQGGGFEPGLKKKETKDSIKNESDNGLSNKEGTIAMARTQIADSATSQFFINTADNAKKLDKEHCADGVGYCVFGQVSKGFDVVKKIRDVKTETSKLNREESQPVEDVVIKSVRRKK